jgi:hypothetical protein
LAETVSRLYIDASLHTLFNWGEENALLPAACVLLRRFVLAILTLLAARAMLSLMTRLELHTPASHEPETVLARLNARLARAELERTKIFSARMQRLRSQQDRVAMAAARKTIAMIAMAIRDQKARACLHASRPPPVMIPTDDDAGHSLGPSPEIIYSARHEDDSASDCSSDCSSVPSPTAIYHSPYPKAPLPRGGGLPSMCPQLQEQHASTTVYAINNTLFAKTVRLACESIALDSAAFEHISAEDAFLAC